ARLRPDRRVLVSDARNFPTDHYIIEGLARALGGYEVRDVAEGRFDDAAAVLLSEVDYRTAERHDVAEVTARVQDAGALMIWDLCHSVGAMPVDVSAARSEERRVGKEWRCEWTLYGQMQTTYRLTSDQHDSCRA